MTKNKKLCSASLFLWLSLFFMASCGKETHTAQQDDISSDTPIAYANGWGGVPVTIQVSSEIMSENQAHPSFQSVLPQLQTAFNTWNSAIGSQVLILDTQSYLSETGNSLLGCDYIFDRLYFPLCYPFKGIFHDRVSTSDVLNPQTKWTSGWVYNTGKNASVLATTVWNSSGSTLTAVGIRFNRDSYVFADSTLDSSLVEDGTHKTLVDLQSVMLHELGHALGLGHTPKEKDSIMYPTMTIGPDQTNPNYQSSVLTTTRTLSACDINRVRYIYAGGTLLTACK